MKFSAGLVAAGLAASVQAYGYADTGCVDGLHFVVAAGEFTSQGNLSYLQSTMDLFMSEFANSNLYQLPYQIDASPQTDLSTMIPALTSHITSYAAACPNTKIVTIGYSIGAAIVMDVLCGGTFTGTNPDPLSRDFRSNILANIIYGDPTFVSGMRSSSGTCTSGKGVAARVFPGKCYPYGRKTKSYCDTNDPQCCGDGVGDSAVHFTYPTNYNADAAHWIHAKLTYFKHHGKSN